MEAIRYVLITFVLSACGVGCGAQSKTFTFTATPPDAEFNIDGVPSGRGPITREFAFDAARPSHRVVASRLGYKELMKVITPDTKPQVAFNLEQRHRDVFITVQPAPAIVTIDGKPVNNGQPVQSFSTKLDFTVNARNEWCIYVQRAERVIFLRAEKVIAWPDTEPYYVLKLEPMRKDFSIRSDPPGATVYLDNEKIGTTPLVDKQRDFP